MDIAQTRALIGTVVEAAIARGFAADLLERDRVGADPHTLHPAHNPDAAPPVPAPEVSTRDAGERGPHSLFTWKVENHDRPYVVLCVEPTWRHEVARPGYAVLDGHPVLAVEQYVDSRPARVKAMIIEAYFDRSLHGWRAYARDAIFAVAWGPDGAAHLTPAA